MREDWNDEEDEEQKPDDGPQIHRARIAEGRRLDWVRWSFSTGTGSASAPGWALPPGRRLRGFRPVGPRLLGGIAFAVAALIGIFVAFFVAAWGPAVWAAAATVAWIALRRLSRAAFPAAFLAFAALAFVPIVGYVEAVTTPLVGERLRRRAGEKHAGLRVLAKD